MVRRTIWHLAKADLLTKYGWSGLLFRGILLGRMSGRRFLLSRRVVIGELRTKMGRFCCGGIDTAHYDDKVDDSYIGDQEKYRFFQNEKKSIYYIPQKHKKGILNALNRLGINKAYVYPEIDDVADYLKNTIED